MELGQNLIVPIHMEQTMDNTIEGTFKPLRVVPIDSFWLLMIVPQFGSILPLTMPLKQI